jgi:hypothetical protein
MLECTVRHALVLRGHERRLCEPWNVPRTDYGFVWRGDDKLGRISDCCGACAAEDDQLDFSFGFKPKSFGNNVISSLRAPLNAATASVLVLELASSPSRRRLLIALYVPT